MVTQYKITSAITDGTSLTIIARCCEEVGTRKDVEGKEISIKRCRNVTVVMEIEGLPAKEKPTYIREQIETAYAALPNETLVRQLIGKTWSS